MSEYELRAVGTFEIRGEGDEPRTLVGVSPPWDTLSTPGAVWGVDREKFSRGAFSNLDDDILITVEHDNSKILGKTASGTLKLSDTPEGLRYEVELPDTSVARDLIASVERGDIDSSSFEFMSEEEEIDVADGEVIRTVTKAKLRQVGPVARPAFGDAPKVSLRCQQKVAALTAPKVDEEAARERRSQIREAELALAESSLSA